MSAEIIPWPTDEGIWMGNIGNRIGWFPLQTRALKDDLPSLEQMRLEKESPETAPPRATLAIVAQFPKSKTSWLYTFQSCHPVNEWRHPDEDEMRRARIFYGLDKPQEGQS